MWGLGRETVRRTASRTIQALSNICSRRKSAIILRCPQAFPAIAAAHINSINIASVNVIALPRPPRIAMSLGFGLSSKAS